MEENVGFFESGVTGSNHGDSNLLIIYDDISKKFTDVVFIFSLKLVRTYLNYCWTTPLF